MSDLPCQEWGGEGREEGGTHCFFLLHKTDFWKSMSRWQRYYRYHPLYVSAEGSVLTTFISFPVCLWFQLNSYCFLNCDNLYYLIKERVKALVWHCNMVPPVDKPQQTLLLRWYTILFIGFFFLSTITFVHVQLEKGKKKVLNILKECKHVHDW